MSIGILVLQLAALACLLFAALRWLQGPPNRPDWGWLGMFLWLLSLMVSGITLHATN